MALALILSQIVLEPHAEVSTGLFTKNEQKRGGWAFFRVSAEVIRIKGIGLDAGGWSGVMTKEGQGIIRFAPWWADYCGFIGLRKDGLGLRWEHACFHRVDTAVERSLFWNNIRLWWEGKRGPLWAFLSGSFYINDKDMYWLSAGADYANDLTLEAEYSPFPYAFLRFWNFTGIGLNYKRFHIGTEIDAGVLLTRKDVRLRFYLGWRPYDRTQHRPTEAFIAGLRMGF
ncbi:MAG: hypothetical protein ABIM74_08465 [candidate division WOR-3 bacterium]